MSDLRPAAGVTSDTDWRHVGPASTILLTGLVAVITALALITGVRPAPPTAREVRQRLFDEMQPITLKNCTLERIGSPGDGGYLFCANLIGKIDSAYSYGIAGGDDWGCQVSHRWHVPVHEYDCFDLTQPACPGGRLLFHPECVGGRREIIESRPYDSVASQIARNSDNGKTLLMKMDVEGSEVEALMATPNRVLNRIDQLAIEIHGADRRFLDLVRKLKRTFYVVHLHYNNSRCSSEWKPLPSSVYEMTFVNKRVGTPDPDAPPPALPSSLDVPNTSFHVDCQTPIPTQP